MLVRTAVVSTSPTQRPELFNALLGAGANSLGVVVTMVSKRVVVDSW